MTHPKAAALGLALLLAVSPATAQSVTATDPVGVLRAVQEAGYTATLTTDNLGDPKIDAANAETAFAIFFYGCVEGAACTNVQFSAGYDLATPTTASRMNDWNRENRFGRAFIDDEGDPFLRMDVVLRGRGMATGSFSYQLEYWDLLLGEFERFIDW